MQRKMWRFAAFPFLVLPTLLVMLLTSCGHKDAPAPGSPKTQQVAASGPPRSEVLVTCGSSGCLPLDEFDNLQDAGSWTTLTCDGGPCCEGATSLCDITGPLQEAVSAMAANSNLRQQQSVLYIPPNLYYSINKPIWVVDAYGGIIIGDDPTTTVITWAGDQPGEFDAGTSDAADAGLVPSQGAAMFVLQDSTSTKLARLTLNGQVGGPVAFDGGSQQWVAGAWVAQSAGYQAAGNHSIYFLDFDDLIFENLSFGIVTYNYSNEWDDPSDGGGIITSQDPPYAIGTNYQFNLLDGGVVGSNVGNIDVRRSSFENISVQGIALSGDNTLDWLIEDNAFIGCHRGVVLNQLTSANLVNNFFFNDPSSTDDSINIVAITGYGQNVYRGNVSVGAMMFYAGLGNRTDMSGNYVRINPSSKHCNAIHEAGWVLLLDNYISMPADGGCTQEAVQGCGTTWTNTAAVELTNLGSLVHGGNAYTGLSSSLVRYDDVGWGGIKEYCVGGSAGCPATGESADTFGAGVSPPTAAYNAWKGWGSPDLTTNLTTAHRPTFAPKVTTRTVVNVATQWPSCVASGPSNTCTLPSSTCVGTLTGMGINGWLQTQATMNPSGQYLLYFPGGSYCIEQSIVVPAGLDVVIEGDGAPTNLAWTGAALDSAIFEAKAPAKAMFKDFQLVVSFYGSRPVGILVDSPGNDTNGLVLVDNTTTAFTRTGLELAGLDGVLVRGEQFGPGGEHGVSVIGGGAANAQSASPPSSNTLGLFMIAGGIGPYADFVSLKNWGKAVLVGLDSEGNQGMALDQSGYLTMDSGRFLPFVVPYAYRGVFAPLSNAVAQSTFHGNVTVTNLQDNAGTFSIAAAQAQVLAIGNAVFPQNTLRGPGGTTGAPNCPSCSPTGVPCGSPASTAPFDSVVEPHAGGMPQMGLGNGGPCVCGTNPATGFTFYADSNNTSGEAMPTTTPNAFAATMLYDLRNAPYAAPICPAAGTCGQTQVRIHGVYIQGGTMPSPNDWLRAGIRVQRSN